MHKAWGGAARTPRANKARPDKGGSRRRKKGRGRKKGGRVARSGSARPRNRPRGYCVCTACGVKIPLYTDVPCYVMSCPKCGLTMVKEGAKSVDSDEQPTD